MIDKQVSSPAAAVVGIADGATVMVGGFGDAGVPAHLIDAILDLGSRHLTIISNNAGSGETGLAALFREGRIDRLVCSYPRQAGSHHFEAAYRAGRVVLDLVPQGTLAARIEAAGSGIGAFFTPTSYGTMLAEGKETRCIDGRDHVLEMPLRADFALVKALRGDRWGNLVYRKASRNFGPIMAAAASRTIVEVDEIVSLGALDPEAIVTPGIYVDRLCAVGPRDLPDALGDTTGNQRSPA